MRVDGPEANPATCEPQAGRAHADRTDTNARGEPAFAGLPLSKSRRAVFLQAQDSQRFKLVEIGDEHDRAKPPARPRGVFQRYRSNSDIQRSQSLKRQAIRFASKILVQGIPKHLVGGCGIGKQSHRRMKFKIVRVAKNLANRTSLYEGY